MTYRLHSFQSRLLVPVSEKVSWRLATRYEKLTPARLALQRPGARCAASNTGGCYLPRSSISVPVTTTRWYSASSFGASSSGAEVRRRQLAERGPGRRSCLGDTP
jgi:hypothetical protein